MPFNPDKLNLISSAGVDQVLQVAEFTRTISGNSFGAVPEIISTPNITGQSLFEGVFSIDGTNWNPINLMYGGWMGFTSVDPWIELSPHWNTSNQFVLDLWWANMPANTTLTVKIVFFAEPGHGWNGQASTNDLLQWSSEDNYQKNWLNSRYDMAPVPHSSSSSNIITIPKTYDGVPFTKVWAALIDSSGNYLTGISGLYYLQLQYEAYFMTRIFSDRIEVELVSDSSIGESYYCDLFIRSYMDNAQY